MMQGCHPLSELRNAVGAWLCRGFGRGKRTRKAQPQTPRLELTELDVHARTLAHGSPAASPRHAYKSDLLLCNLVLDHALSPAFDVASPTSQGPSCPHKSDHDDRCSLGNGPLHVRDRALVLIGSPAHCHRANWSPVTSARRPPTGGYSESAMNPTKRPESEIQGPPYELRPDLPGSGVASMN